MALELTKLIITTNAGIYEKDDILNLFSECLGVAKGDSLEVVRLQMKLEKEAVTKQGA